MSRRIKKLHIENFRQFHFVDIDFPKLDVGHDINVIIGDNRFGKTNLLNSILWALYGENVIDDNLNPNIRNERYSNEDVLVKIEIEARERNNGGIIERTTNNFSYIRRDELTNKFVPSENPKEDIESVISKNVKNLFLFKGEYLDTFFEQQNKYLLKDTVEKVSKLDRFLKIHEILTQLEQSYRKEIARKNSSNKKLAKITENITELQNLIKKHETKIKENDRSVREYNNRIGIINDMLKGLSEEHVNSLLEQEEYFKEQENSIVSFIKKINSDIRNIFVEKISFWFLYEGISEFKEEINSLEAKGHFPPPVIPQTIKKIFENQRCICGNSLTPDMKNNLEDLLHAVQSEKYNLESLYKLNLSLDADKKEFEKLFDKFNELMSQKNNYEQKLDGIRQKLNGISEELKTIDTNEIYRLQSEKETLDEEINKLNADTNLKKNDIHNHKMDLLILDTEFKKLSSKSHGTEMLNKKLNLCMGLNEKVGSLSNDISDNIRQKLNKKTKECFQQIFWENYRYIEYDIRLNDDYEIEVLSPKGNNMIGYLSTGEKKVLALSFMTSLSDFYGFDFPLVIDAPFTALQKKVIMNVLDTLNEISKNKQIIIFTIPHEDEIMKKLTENANKIYKFKKDAEDNTILEST